MNLNDILFGLIAFQNGYVDRAQLVGAFAEWVKDQSISIEDRLVKQQAMTAEDCNFVKQLARKYLSLAPSKQTQSLFSSASSLHEELFRLANQGNLSEEHQDMFSQTMEFVIAGAQTSQKSPATISMDRERFRIVKEHARGGLGVVFIAEDQQLRREVAVKRIRDDRADLEPIRAKFRKEAEVTGRLEHPGIVPIYSMGSDEQGRPFYAMRFIRGESLQDCIESMHKQLSIQSTKMDSPRFRHLLRRFIDVCNAMDYAHEQGILHRDLKPGNIMLGKYGETLVVDWGLAKLVAIPVQRSTAETPSQIESELFSKDEDIESKTREGSFLGTTAYAPPEQLQGQIERLSRSSDVYSLGAILFQILTGRPPVSKADSIGNAIKQIEALQNRDLREFRRDIPEPLACICSKAIRLEIGERFETVGQLRDGVQAWLDDVAVPGIRESLRSKASRWIRNHQTIVAVSLVSLVAITGVLAISVFAIDSYFRQEQKHLANEKQLRITAQAAEADAKKANIDLMLSDANLARNRGQFLEASRMMLKVSERETLDEDQKLSLVRDQYFAQNTDSAWIAIQEIDPTKLTDSRKAELDLLRGDMQLMTRFEKEGFALIRRAISSKLLTPADLAYANGLVAETAEECQNELRTCVQLEPLNLNAISKLAVTCVLVGDLEEAKRNTDFGISLAPDDIRFQFLEALISAVTCDEAKTKAAIVHLKQTEGLESEISLVEITLNLSKSFEHYFLSLHSIEQPPPDSTITTMDSLSMLSKIVAIAMKKHSNPKLTAIPRMAWMGKLVTTLPNAGDLVIASLGGGLSNRFEKLAKVLPRHQWIQIALGIAQFKDSNHKQAAVAFARAARCDALGPHIRRKAAWFAMGCLATHSIITKESIADSEIAELARWIEMGKTEEQSYISSPWSNETAFSMLAHAKLFGVAIELAEQVETKFTSESERSPWRKRIESLRGLGEKLSKEAHDIANPVAESSE